MVVRVSKRLKNRKRAAHIFRGGGDGGGSGGVQQKKIETLKNECSNWLLKVLTDSGVIDLTSITGVWTKSARMP